jgi:uncharacterized protein (DUF1697 family)
MNATASKKTYIAFLRGINVGGHHKVPMADLRNKLEKLGFENVVTLLNSGNVIFDSTDDEIDTLERILSEHLEKSYGFPVPTILRTSEMICELLENNPFKTISVTKDTRLYISFLREHRQTELKIPWESQDKSFKIIDIKEKILCSVLDLSVSKTPKAMEVLERYFGKDITTRNWNTIEQIGKKIHERK